MAGPRSGKRDCIRLLRGALGWIDRHLADFDPFQGGQAFAIRNGQRVGELALLLQAYVRLTGNRRSRRVRRMAALLQTILRNREFSDRLLRSQVDFVLVTQVYAALRAVGHEAMPQSELLNRLVRINFPQQTERLPYRLMEVVFCLEWAGLRHALPSLESLYKRSILGRTPSPLYLHDDDIYAITHTLMYLFGLGTRRRAAVPARQRNQLNETLSVLLVIACQDHHWDLLAELLLCWDCLGNEASVTYERGWRTLLGTQRSDGSVPGPEWAERLHATARSMGVEAHSESSNFSHHYHTTLVSCLAALVRLRSTRSIELAAGPACPETRRPIRRSQRSRRRTDDPAGPLRQARPWFDQLLETAQQEKETPPETWCQILLGFWICDSLADSSDGGFLKAARAIGEALNHRGMPSGAGWSRTSPALKLITAALLARHQVAVDYLHGDAGYVRQAQSFLQGLPRSKTDDEISFYEKRFLLHRLGQAPKPNPAGAAEVVRFARALPLTDTGAGRERFLDLIFSATEFGTGGTAISPPGAWFTDMVAGFTSAAFRKYDLIAGSRWLRAAQYLGIGGAMLEDGQAFLRLHQRPEGPFGFFGDEERRLLQQRPKARSSLFVEISLYLPVTVECLWTLAEVGNSWRLYGAILPSGKTRPAASAFFTNVPT